MLAHQPHSTGTSGARRAAHRSTWVATLFLCLLGWSPLGAAEASAKSTPVSFGFWNLENLFDAEDDPKNPGDNEYLPDREWTEERYQRKLNHLAEIIAELDCDILGVCEVENRRVLDDLVALPKLAPYKYQVVHKDSPDKRGIDLALLYRAPVQPRTAEDFFRIHTIPIDPPTRGVFEVDLQVSGHPLTVLVNHWPSRRGGSKSVPFRKKAADVCKRVIRAAVDAQRDRDADILLLGDFNDDPFDASVRYELGAIRSRNAVLNRDKGGRYRLYNPMWKFLGQTDVGTLYYNREWVWNVFDQCIVSRGLLKSDGFQLVEESLTIHATDKMRDHYRRPLRFRRQGKKWVEGYSDHFPIRGVMHVQAQEKPAAQ